MSDNRCRNIFGDCGGDRCYLSTECAHNLICSWSFIHWFFVSNLSKMSWLSNSLRKRIILKNISRRIVYPLYSWWDIESFQKARGGKRFNWIVTHFRLEKFEKSWKGKKVNFPEESLWARNVYGYENFLFMTNMTIHVQEI